MLPSSPARDLRGLEGVPGLPGAPQDEAGLTRKFVLYHCVTWEAPDAMLNLQKTKTVSDTFSFIITIIGVIP